VESIVSKAFYEFGRVMNASEVAGFNSAIAGIHSRASAALPAPTSTVTASGECSAALLDLPRLLLLLLAYVATAAISAVAINPVLRPLLLTPPSCS